MLPVGTRVPTFEKRVVGFGVDFGALQTLGRIAILGSAGGEKRCISYGFSMVFIKP